MVRLPQPLSSALLPCQPSTAKVDREVNVWFSPDPVAGQERPLPDCFVSALLMCRASGGPPRVRYHLPTMSLADDVRAYAAGVCELPRYADEALVENVLYWRDRIHALLRAGVPLDPADQDLLDRADRALVEQRAELIRRWPGVFCGNNLPQVRWWWHLDLDGPPAKEW
ncbi:MAG TPA: hypothetical protein VHL09_11720 [Dehalococcoidia bacterium]|nr:hypothetical protein [Dehalococcoidia bacterium]